MKTIQTSQYRTAQGYADIAREGEEDDETFTARQYFSIGQDDKNNMGVCWALIHGRMRTKQGGTHSCNWGIEARECWRGWYDPDQALLSVVVPRFAKHDDLPKSQSDIPTEVMAKVRQTFPYNYSIKVF